MPQLEMGDFAPQLAWLLITFALLVVVMWKVALPRIAAVLEERERRVSSDLKKAGTLKREAEEVLAAYEQTLAGARASAQAILSEAQDALIAEAAKQKAALAEELAVKAAEAEALIADAREKAMAGIGEMAADLARAATAKLIGAQASETAGETAGAEAPQPEPAPED